MNRFVALQAAPDPLADSDTELVDADAELLRATLHAALGAIEEPTVVVHRSGRPVLANARGRDWLASSTTELASLVEAAISSGPGQQPAGFRVSPIQGRHGAELFLVVGRSSGTRSEQRMLQAASRWRLTRAETRVFKRLGRGITNRAIARELDCSIRTVELHVSSILKKAQVKSRAELIVKLLGTPG